MTEMEKYYLRKNKKHEAKLTDSKAGVLYSLFVIVTSVVGIAVCVNYGWSMGAWFGLTLVVSIGALFGSLISWLCLTIGGE